MQDKQSNIAASLVSGNSDSEEEITVLLGKDESKKAVVAQDKNVKMKMLYYIFYFVLIIYL